MSTSRQSPGRARTDLIGRKILLVEDDFFEARDLQQALQHAGARVIGPCGNTAAALRAIADHDLSCAILDIQLGGERRFNIATALEDKGIPFLFLTGMNRAAIPEELQ